MTTTPNEEFTAFDKEDIVYDDGCIPGEWECGKEDPLTYVNREDPEHVIHEACYYQLKPRQRAEFIAIKDVPSGEMTAAEKVEAAIGNALDEDEYELDEPVSVELSE